MQSNGGVAAVESFHAVSSVLSGPAGGLIGMGWIGRRLGVERLIGFDMGGTSTDVSLIDGDLPRRFEHIIAGVRLLQPMLDVHTIAAGGGSIVNFSDGRFAVGPASAGSDPGPACYAHRRRLARHFWRWGWRRWPTPSVRSLRDRAWTRMTSRRSVSEEQRANTPVVSLERRTRCACRRDACAVSYPPRRGLGLEVGARCRCWRAVHWRSR